MAEIKATSWDSPKRERNHEDGLLCKIKNLQHDCTSIQPYTFLTHHREKQKDCDWPLSAHEDRFPQSLESGPTLSSFVPWSDLMSMTLRRKHWSQPIQRLNPPWCDDSQQRTSTRHLPDRIQNRSMRQAGVRVACFYIYPVGFQHISRNEHYIAIYLFDRAASHFTRRTA